MGGTVTPCACTRCRRADRRNEASTDHLCAAPQQPLATAALDYAPLTVQTSDGKVRTHAAQCEVVRVGGGAHCEGHRVVGEATAWQLGVGKRTETNVLHQILAWVAWWRLEGDAGREASAMRCALCMLACVGTHDAATQWTVVLEVPDDS
jgi:hypothetical protein